MGSLSKYFEESARGKCCADFIHPGQTCTETALSLLPIAAFGAIKFNFPICFTQFLMKIKNWDRKKTWIDFFKNYLQCVCASYCLPAFSMTLFCVYYHFLKKIPPLPLFVSVPSALGCVFAHFVPHKVRYPQALGITGLFFEFLMRSSKNCIIKAIRRSRSLSTVHFMLLSAIISTTMFYTQTHRFWFAKIDGLNDQCAPSSKTTDVNFNELVPYDTHQLEKQNFERRCNHVGRCEKMILRDLKFSVLLGLVLGSLRVLLPRLKLFITQPLQLIKIFHSKFDYGIFGYFSCYATVFRIVNCCLNQKTNLTRLVKLGISGFIAGGMFFFYPDFVLFNFALTAAIELVWKSAVKRMTQSKKERLKKIIAWIDKIPMTTVLYILGVGVMFQLRVVYPYYTNPIVYRLMNIGTGHRTDMLAENYAAIMMGLK